ncbi:hypothetical protein L249_4179 [Ophiocordyceps polyrhachis-furcata BCC 54312]|uniref:Uncharacterized protein n=1 Tax=Ophiocordyceps polyrhachis-furcata BCC 54312 TaxID=1330021 RepID=A0A367L6G2_9HYPO|nr:hypothetical protein L249_4179 [Ophiocordyceps polyrhachis-furcata BCC 54312]
MTSKEGERAEDEADEGQDDGQQDEKSAGGGHDVLFGVGAYAMRSSFILARGESVSLLGGPRGREKGAVIRPHVGGRPGTRLDLTLTDG